MGHVRSTEVEHTPRLQEVIGLNSAGGWAFLSVAIGQRPGNYLNCCCSCSPFGSFPLLKEIRVKKILPDWESNRGPSAKRSIN